LRQFLLDTSVVSAFGPGKTPASPLIAGWIRTHADQLFISAVTVMEIESGIRQFARTGSTRRLSDLTNWLAVVRVDFRDRILPFEENVAMTAGRLEALALAKGRHPGLSDIVIAATGELHGMTILTRNLRHFEPLEVSCLDPFRELPSGPTA
jgi:predicted nucleic acid-binding protein